MLDMRYHIASLIAVFLALAIGILLGTVIVDKGLLANQQTSLVKRIESNFNVLREENRTLKSELYEKREFENKAVPLVIKDKLAGANVVIIATWSLTDNSFLTNLTDDLKRAGATVNNVTVEKDFNINDQAITLLQPYIQTPLNKENARELILKRMVDDLGTSSDNTSSATGAIGSDNSYLLQLKSLGFIKTDIDFNVPDRTFDKAIIIGGSDRDEETRITDLPIILELKSLNIRTIGTETSSCKKSYMRPYQAVGIPTVDNINERIGIVSAIYALTGIDGNFGTKKTAGQLMPTLQ